MVPPTVHQALPAFNSPLALVRSKSCQSVTRFTVERITLTQTRSAECHVQEELHWSALQMNLVYHSPVVRNLVASYQLFTVVTARKRRKRHVTIHARMEPVIALWECHAFLSPDALSPTLRPCLWSQQLRPTLFIVERASRTQHLLARCHVQVDHPLSALLG